MSLFSEMFLKHQLPYLVIFNTVMGLTVASRLIEMTER